MALLWPAKKILAQPIENIGKKIYSAIKIKTKNQFVSDFSKRWVNILSADCPSRARRPG